MTYLVFDDSTIDVDIVLLVVEKKIVYNNNNRPQEIVIKQL